MASDTGGSPRRHRSRPVIPAATDALVADDADAAQAWREHVDASWRRVQTATNLVAYLTATGLVPAAVIEDVVRARRAMGDHRLDDDDAYDAVTLTAHQAAERRFDEALWRVRGAVSTLPGVAAADAYHALALQLESAENRLLRTRASYAAAAERVDRDLAALDSAEAQRDGRVYRRRPLVP